MNYDLSQDTKDALSREFKLPYKVISELGKARSDYDAWKMNYGSYKSPVKTAPKYPPYEKHGLDIETGEAVAWAWMWEMTIAGYAYRKEVA